MAGRLELEGGSKSILSRRWWGASGPNSVAQAMSPHQPHMCHLLRLGSGFPLCPFKGGGSGAQLRDLCKSESRDQPGHDNEMRAHFDWQGQTKWKKKRDGKDGKVTRPGGHSFSLGGHFGESIVIMLGSRFQLVVAGNTVLERRRVLQGRRWRARGMEASGHFAKTGSLGCRLKFGGEGGGLHNKWAVALIRQGGGPRPEQSPQWARSPHQPIDSAGIGETAAKRKICAAIFNDIPTRPPTLTIKKSTTTPLLHRKSRGLDIACHPE
jgi:hypothetical protein